MTAMLFHSISFSFLWSEFLPKRSHSPFVIKLLISPPASSCSWTSSCKWKMKKRKNAINYYFFLVCCFFDLLHNVLYTPCLWLWENNFIRTRWRGERRKIIIKLYFFQRFSHFNNSFFDCFFRSDNEKLFFDAEKIFERKLTKSLF